MHAKERPEFVTVISALAVSFGKEASEPLLMGYWLGLQDMPLPDVKRAATRAMRERKFMPVPAELRELAGELTPADRAVIAWDSAFKANREHGYYETVDFDDPAVNATVRSMGGWEAFAERLDAEDVAWLRKEFERVYQVYARRGVTAAEGAPLVGFHDRNNRLNGYTDAIHPPLRIATTLSPARQLVGGCGQAGTIDAQMRQAVAMIAKAVE
jgi:hypothetical protein